MIFFYSNVSHKKRKDSLEGSLDQALFMVELGFPKILVPGLAQKVSNVNIEYTGNSKQLYSSCDQLLGALIYLHFIVLILICFWLIMAGVNHAKYSCSSFRMTPGALLYRSFTPSHCYVKTLLQLLLNIGW